MSGAALGKAAALLAGLLAAAAPAAGQNLAGNGEFDEHTEGWYLGGAGTVEWSVDDHDACAASGSAQLTNAQAGTLDLYLIRCAPGVVAEQVYSLGADFNFPGGQAISGSAQIEARFYADVNCAGSAVGFVPSPLVLSTASGVWQRSESLDAFAPPTSQAVQIGIVVHKDDVGPLVALVDGVFVLSGAGLVFVDGFDSGATCRWSAEGPERLANRQGGPPV